MFCSILMILFFCLFVYLFVCLFVLPSSVRGFFPVNTMHIQHEKDFIELIAHNTLVNKKDP